MNLYQKLWDLAEREGQKRNINPSSLFLDIGLRLNDIKDLDRDNYSSTPINSITFAGTGGDGVHFGLLHVDGNIVDTSPVIMTVPMMFNNPNVIVGESISEFLSLGCETGYFVLEQIAYGFREQNILDWFKNHRNHMDDKEQELLQILKTEFDLKPWKNPEARLNELQEQYLSLLQLKEDD